MVNNRDFARNLFITVLLILMFWLIVSAARAQTVFDSVWLNRVELPLVVESPGFTKPAEAFDEEQFREETRKKHRSGHVADPDRASHHDRIRSVHDCMTLQEARRRWPGKYLSWRGNHCWFAKPRRRDDD
jgi:hypothetical protein